MPAADTEAMQAHLDVIEGQVAPGAVAVSFEIRIIAVVEADFSVSVERSLL